jgi:hypothetical protein
MATKNTKQDFVEEIVEDEVVEQETPKKSTARPKTRKFDPTETFPCRSVCYGELILEGYKSKILYTWANCGDYADVEYQDLQALQSRKSRFLTDPLFIIEDEELVEQWGSLLKPVYSKIEEDDIEKLLNLTPTQLKKKLKVMPNGIKESIETMAASKIMSGELDSLNRIKAIDEVLGTELMSMIS